jgi:glycerol-1-phosphate dehydrogenase [NAD(P)+]
MSVAHPQSAPDTARDLDALRGRFATAEEAADLRPLGLGGVLLGRGVLARLVSVATDLRCADGDVVVVADCRPMSTANAELKETVAAAVRGAGMPLRRVTVGDGRADTHADDATLKHALRASAGASLLVSVGSGTVADIGKALSARLGGIPHVVVQSAASVNGFADDQSVLLIDGVKRTTATRWPDQLLIDTEVVARAPAELNRAGLGDLLATYTAPADWLLARLVGQDDSYSPAVVALARSHVDAVLDGADGIHRGDPAAIENLSAALTLSGISMGVAGRTAPGSGMEHTVSHLLEMAQPPGEPGALHGAKVGVLSVLAAMVWARVRTVARGGGLHALRFPDADEMQARVQSAFDPIDQSGAIARECWRGYARKLERWNRAHAELQKLPERWAAFDTELDDLLASPERLHGALRTARAPVRLGALGVPDSRARWALANGHLMRDRFTVADLAFFMGIWEPADVDELLRTAARMGAGV